MYCPPLPMLMSTKINVILSQKVNDCLHQRLCSSVSNMITLNPSFQQKTYYLYNFTYNLVDLLTGNLF